MVGASAPGVAAAAASLGGGLSRGLGRGRGGAAIAAGSSATAGSAGDDFTSTGSVSGAGVGAAGAAASSGVGASTSIELPTIAMLFGRSSLGGGGAPCNRASKGSSTTAPCSPTESRNAATFPSVDGFTAALISLSDTRGRRRFRAKFRARERLSRSPSRPIHPGWLRCSSVTYLQYAPSSRLAIRAPRPRSSTDLAIRGPLAPQGCQRNDVGRDAGAGRLFLRFFEAHGAPQREVEQVRGPHVAERGEHVGAHRQILVVQRREQL